jgi:hypothetical protein
MEEIRNKVKESGLINLDLADFKPNEVNIISFDLADFLWQGLVLKEKEFRNSIATHDWSQFQGKTVYIHCSADAIVPTWAYMLVSSQLNEIASFHCVGSKEDLVKMLIENNIHHFNTEHFNNERFIIKGCSDIAFPEFAMVQLMKKIIPCAKSIMYGEPCSTVPIYKKK